MTIGKFTENCTNQYSLIVNDKDNLTVKRVKVSIIYFDMIRASTNSILGYRRNSISLYRESILRIVYEESDRCLKCDDRVIVIVGLLVMTVSGKT
jgi:hypothetical protein